MERRNTRSMRSSSLDEEHETTPTKRGKQDSEGKSGKKGQSTQKGPSQSSSLEVESTKKHQKGAEHDDSHADTSKKHGKTSEKRTETKDTEKGKHDNDNDDTKSKPSVNRVISSKHTPQQRKALILTDSKKKVKSNARSPAVLHEIRSSSSPFRAETPTQSRQKSGTKSSAKSDTKSVEKGHEQVHESTKVTTFSPKDPSLKGSVQHKSPAKGSVTHKNVSQEELADQMVGEAPSGSKGKRDTHVDRKNQILVEDDEEVQTHREVGGRGNKGGADVFNEQTRTHGDHRTEESHMHIEEETRAKPAENRKPNATFNYIQKVLQDDKSGAHSYIRQDASNNQETSPNRQEDNHDTHHKYAVGEDLKILDYINETPGNKISKNYWKTAFDRDGLLNKRRSIDSLRDRYRNQLRYLSIDQVDNMKNWVAIYGEKGFASFTRKAIKDPSGKIIYIKEFDCIDPDVGTNRNAHFNSNNDKKKDHKTGRPDKPQGNLRGGKAKPNLASDIEEDDIESVDEDESEEERPPVQRKEVFAHREPVQKKQFTPSEEDPNPRYTEKRKNYGSMHHIDEQALPRKTTREAPSYRSEERFFNTQEEEKLRDKEIWLRELAYKHSISPEQLKVLFYRCSMNSLILDRYFKGEHNLIWDKDEDSLLTGPYKEIAKRVLTHHKGAANVRQRAEFLDRFEQMQSLRPHSFAQKQSANFTQKKREFL